MTDSFALCIGAVFCTAVMTFAWVIAVKTDFYSLVDGVWAYGIGALVALYAVVLGDLNSKKIISLIMALAWSMRLGTHLTRRLTNHFPQEDSRYIDLKSKWTKFNFFVFFQFQALSQILFSIPFLIVMSDSNNRISYLNVLGVILFSASLFLEAVSDRQLKIFRSKPENKGRVCDSGLWRYSRHPNYFFEWLVWCGVAVMAIDAPYGYWGLVSPILMFITLNYLTGIPAAEKQSIASKGDLYNDYKKKTNRFFLGFQK